jgi:hypothetical protein
VRGMFAWLGRTIPEQAPIKPASDALAAATP